MMMSFELFIGDGSVGTVGKCPWFAKQKKEKNENYRLKSFAYNKKNRFWKYESSFSKRKCSKYGEFLPFGDLLCKNRF